MIVLKRSDDRPPVRDLSLCDPVPSPAEAPLTILLVEDEPDTAFAQALILKMSGMQVSVAATPPDALTLAASHVFDVALIDIGLKHEIDGIDLGSMLRALPGNGKLPLIALTGWQDQDSRAAESGFCGYLLKPVQACHVLDIINVAINRRPSQQNGDAHSDDAR
jgi:CheY-like chemotaxis protein